MGNRLVLAGSAKVGAGADQGATQQLVYNEARVPAGMGAGIRTVLGDDERSHVADTGAAPWRIVCHLAVEGRFRSVVGTGWFAGPRTIVTAGHCVFDTKMGGLAKRIRVSPGMRDGDTSAFGSIEATRFTAAPAWLERGDADFDIGVIQLDAVPGQADPGDRLGWFGVASLRDAELRDAMVNVSGYPMDKPQPRNGGMAGTQQWHARNRIVRVTDRRLLYEADTAAGQSGGPAYIIDEPGGTPMVVGIHAYGIEGTPGGTVNSAPRITPEVMQLIQQWIDES